MTKKTPKKEVYYSSKFVNHYNKRIKNNKNLVKTVEEVTNLLLESPQSSILQNHSLQGPMQGLRAISVTSDYRIILQETKNSYTFIDIGTHEQVYEK
jgi:addiction module RelE/StbE family toxin